METDCDQSTDSHSDIILSLVLTHLRDRDQGEGSGNSLPNPQAELVGAMTSLLMGAGKCWSVRDGQGTVDVLGTMLNQVCIL